MQNNITDVQEWAESMIKSGKYPDSTGRYRLSALELLTSVLAENEPKDANYILENLSEIALRWATKNKKTGETTGTYQSRVKGLLSDYLTWKADPTAFKGRRASSPRPLRSPPKGASADETSTPAPLKAAAAQSTEVFEMISLGNGRMFKFSAPEMTMKDAARIAYALACRATDFDPLAGSPFSAAKTGSGAVAALTLD